MLVRVRFQKGWKSSCSCSFNEKSVVINFIGHHARAIIYPWPTGAPPTRLCTQIHSNIHLPFVLVASSLKCILESVNEKYVCSFASFPLVFFSVALQDPTPRRVRAWSIARRGATARGRTTHATTRPRTRSNVIHFIGHHAQTIIHRFFVLVPSSVNVFWRASMKNTLIPALCSSLLRCRTAPRVVSVLGLSQGAFKPSSIPKGDDTVLKIP